MGFGVMYVLVTYRPEAQGRSRARHSRCSREFRCECFLLCHVLNPGFIHLTSSVLTFGLFQAENLEHARRDL